MIQPMVDKSKIKRGTRIASAIEAAGLSQRQAASLIGVSPQSITKWIKTGSIQVENLVYLSDITGVELRYLIEGDVNTIREKRPVYNPSRVKLHHYVSELSDAQVKKLILCAEALNESDESVSLSIKLGNKKLI